jgi:integrase
MASYQKRTYANGSKKVMAWVRLKDSDPTCRSFPTQAEAKAWAESLEATIRKQHKSGGARRDLVSLTVADLITEYLDDPKTLQLRYFHDLQMLTAWWVNHFGNVKVLDFGVTTAREARKKLNSGRAPATINRYLSAMRSAWNWGIEAALVPTDRVWPKKLLLKEADARVRYLKDDELTAVLDAAKKHGAWIHAAVVLSIATGLRQGEMLRLEWKDIDLVKATVTVLISKNTRRRTMHLPAPALDALKNLRRNGIVGPSRVFVTDKGEPINMWILRYHWCEVREAAGLKDKDFRWHDLRHTCASFLAQNGANLLEIGSVLGHRNPSITEKYAHLIEGKAVTGADKLGEKLSIAMDAKL